MNTESSRLIDDAIDDVTDNLCFECDALRTLLHEKNEAYGDSVMNPVRVFTDPKVSAMTSLCQQLDHKISRAIRGNAGGEDVLRDMIGYLVLARCLIRAGQSLSPGVREWLHVQLVAIKLGLEALPEVTDEEQIPPTERDPGCREF